MNINCIARHMLVSNSVMSFCELLRKCILDLVKTIELSKKYFYLVYYSSHISLEIHLILYSHSVKI